MKISPYVRRYGNGIPKIGKRKERGRGGGRGEAGRGVVGLESTCKYLVIIDV